MQVKKETTGLFESEGFRNTLMGLLTQREQQIAEYLVEAFHWWSNDDWGLISMLVHRTPEEMKSIKEYYMQCHNKDLIQDIRKYCKADIDKSCASDIPKAGEYLSGKVLACLISNRHELSREGPLADVSSVQKIDASARGISRRASKTKKHSKRVRNCIDVCSSKRSPFIVGKLQHLVIFRARRGGPTRTARRR